MGLKKRKRMRILLNQWDSQLLLAFPSCFHASFHSFILDLPFSSLIPSHWLSNLASPNFPQPPLLKLIPISLLT